MLDDLPYVLIFIHFLLFPLRSYFDTSDLILILCTLLVPELLSSQLCPAIRAAGYVYKA